MNIIRLSLVVTVCLFLAGCNGSALQSGWKLRNVDPGTLDPAQVRLAIHAPPWMRSMLDDLQLSVRFQSMDRAVAAGLFRLRRIDRPADIATIQRAGLAVENLSIFEITPEDLKAARKFQSELVALRSAGPGGNEIARIQRKGRAVCLTFPPPGESTNVDLYLHPTDEVGWVLFSENEDIGEFDLADSAPSPDAALCRPSGKNDAGADERAVDPKTSGQRAKKLQGGVNFQSGE
jgi:hypothetical protein